MNYYDDNLIEYGTDKVATDGEPLTLKTAEVTDSCSMKFSAGTNGFKGGDSGHGCRAFISIKDTGGCDLEVIDDTNSDIMCGGYVKISTGGDAELRLLIDGLRWMADTLEEQAHIEKIKKVQKSIGIV